MASTARRLWQAFVPPTVEKSEDALRFGILGAAGAAPLALITPAKSHPEVIVQAVAARNRTFAKSHGIPEVMDSYQDIIDDPNIDCILVPLPNGLHFEWAARAIRAGKHVLLEKPSVANSIEAEILFNLPELSQPNGPVLLEAFHNLFHPSWSFFHSLIEPADVIHVDTVSMIPWWGAPKDAIHFNLPLAGGSMMSMGSYHWAALRLIFVAEPEECLSCDTHSYTEGVHSKCDYDFKAKFRFPNGGIGEAASTMAGPTLWKPSHATVTTREVAIPDKKLSDSHILVRTRELTLHGMLHAVVWHHIDVKDVFEETEGGFEHLPGEDYWMSYRYQLEEFVNRVKGRRTQYWISGQDSIGDMKMMDMAYEKSGLGVRPTSEYLNVH